MLKLKAIINQLSSEHVEALENQFVQNKADNMLFLLKEYKRNVLSDAEIIKYLNLNMPAFHTLKSRLYDKIQIQLIDTSFANRSDILNQLANITQYCYETPRESAEAILHKLENDLKAHDMSGDLITVYSTLKKINLHSQKYYHYSQLYNKHLAYTMALEKAEELLGSFIKILSEYYLTKNPSLFEMLTLIKKEITNIFKLNKSDHIEIIYNTILIHLHLFTDINHENEEATGDLLESTEKIIQKFPNNTLYQVYGTVITFLNYEYYIKIGEFRKAQKYFDVLNDSLKTWLLLDDICLAYIFLFSKITNYCQLNQEAKLVAENQETELIYDAKNAHTQMNVLFYDAVSKFYAGKYHDSTVVINHLINSSSYKDLLHAEIEVKLFLAYAYYKQNEYEMAINAIKSLYRKIKGQNTYDYDNATAFIKMLNLLMNIDDSSKTKEKILKSIRMYELENSGERAILKFFNKEIENLKSKLSK